MGFFIEDCPYILRSINRTLIPLLGQLGIPYERGDTACSTGFGDTGTTTQAMQEAILKWQTEGVNRVMLLTRSEGADLTIFATEAANQHWYPGYATDSDAIPQTLNSAGLVPVSELRNMQGVGWVGVPGFDVLNPAPYPADELAAQANCLALIQKGGYTQAKQYSAFVYEACDPVMLLMAAWHADGGRAGLAALENGVDSLGGSFVGAITGRTSFAATKQTGVSEFRTFAWSTGCSCFVYTSQEMPTP